MYRVHKQGIELSFRSEDNGIFFGFVIENLLDLLTKMCSELKFLGWKNQIRVTRYPDSFSDVTQHTSSTGFRGLLYITSLLIIFSGKLSLSDKSATWHGDGTWRSRKQENFHIYTAKQDDGVKPSASRRKLRQRLPVQKLCYFCP